MRGPGLTRAAIGAYDGAASAFALEDRDERG